MHICIESSQLTRVMLGSEINGLCHLFIDSTTVNTGADFYLFTCLLISFDHVISGRFQLVFVEPFRVVSVDDIECTPYDFGAIPFT